MSKRATETEEEELRRRKLEEALEVKSLRRIISAYLNYPDAAEDDVRGYEKSYGKLPPAHKSLLSHLPSKYKSLRRCISTNTYFIVNMLQAFEPPLDMSLDVDVCEDENHECYSGKHHFHQDKHMSSNHHECYPDEHHFHQDKRISSNHLESAGQNMVVTRDQMVCDAENDDMCKSIGGTTSAEGDQLRGPEFERESSEAGSSAIRASTGQESPLLPVNSNGNVASSSCDWLDPSLQFNVPLVDVDKVRCIIRNIVRDWALEGQLERDQCYQPILDELNRLFPTRSKESPPCCLVPGAGLGRLALEISRLGFICQGNEFSYYMMICSNFILNHSHDVNEWTIYPWIHSNCNSLSDEDQLRPVSIPDILPARNY